MFFDENLDRFVSRYISFLARQLHPMAEPSRRGDAMDQVAVEKKIFFRDVAFSESNSDDIIQNFLHCRCFQDRAVCMIRPDLCRES
jgi:hypothetical protein